MPKILIADKMSSQAAEAFRACGIEVDVATGLAPEELIARIGTYDGLALRSTTKVTEATIVAGTKLKVVGRAGIGVDNIDVEAATRRGIVVMNAPSGNAVTTAEHAIAMLCALAREIPAADRSTRAGKWEKSRFMGVELTGKTLGVIGCGNIGAIVAERGLGLRMRVIAHDPYLSPERARDLGVEKVELDALLARADFITLHVPMTAETRGMIDAAALAKTKRGVRIINCARGGLVVEEDLKAAIESGQVAGAALDVFADEPARDNPLFAFDQVVATPHLGAATAEAQEKVALQIAEQMSDYLLTGAITNALNMPALSAEEAQRLKPYMRLAELLGSFAGQLTRTGLKGLTVEYEGEAAALDCRPLTQIALTGLLRPMVLARQRNIDVTEVKHERDCDYQTLIRLTVTTERGARSVSGTLFGGTKPRLVEIKGIKIEAELGPHMLYTTNEDRPGMIGAIGKILGDAGVNIATFHLGRAERGAEAIAATFHLGRAERGAEAIALLEVDEPISAEVLEKVRALPHIKQAAALRF
ncbi:MAG: phosphoglycerate dehydrogenase [Alphaproteobacteria bacterium]